MSGWATKNNRLSVTQTDLQFILHVDMQSPPAADKPSVCSFPGRSPLGKVHLPPVIKDYRISAPVRHVAIGNDICH
jgi:hypothetical protein